MIVSSRSAGARRLLVTAVLVGAQVGAGLTATGPAAAQPAAVDKEAKRKAGARFKEGEALFQKHAYDEAAKAFEEAQAIAPHPSVLLNAINAHTLAGHVARAATLSSQLVADTRADEKSREEARSKLADLRGKVGRLELRGAQAQKITVDGASASLGEVYVDPGDHRIEAEVSGRQVQRKVTVVAGSSEQILLDAPDPGPTATATATTAATTTPSPPPPPPPGKGLPPLVTYVGVGLTAALGGVTLWSGLDTLKAKKDFDAKPSPTQTDKDDGVAKQTRTNILIGATAVAGVATIGIALFATNWRPGESQMAWLRVGPGSVSVEGAF